MVLWSASQHLIVEAPIAPPNRSRTRQWIGSVAVLVTCAAVLTYFLTRSPGPPLEHFGARSVSGWLQHDSSVLHTRVRLMTLVEYDHGTLADLTITTAPGHEQRITLQRVRGLWHEYG